MTEIPIRCFTCGKVVANKWEPYVRLRKEGIDKTTALNILRLVRPCCRTMIVTHVDLSARLLKFKAMENDNLNGLNIAFTGDEFGDMSDADDFEQ